MVVNGYWHKGELDSLSKFCINTWIKNGFEFHLWTYDLSLKSDSITIKNANTIVDESEYFTYDGGHTVNTPVAFSNLFRAELLYKLGGLYVDLDLLCIKPYSFNDRFVFCEQAHNAYDWLESKYKLKLSIGTSIIYSRDKNERLFKRWAYRIRRLSNGTIRHGDLGPDLFTSLVIKEKLLSYILDKNFFNPIDFFNHNELFKSKLDTYGVHLFASQFKTNNQVDEIINLYS